MIWVLIIYVVAMSAYLAWGGIIGMRFKGTLKHAPLPDRLPSVSTIVPARNEERNIDRCASGIAAQDYANLEFVFVDDDSTDATPDILARYAARDSRVKIVHTGGKPDDWNGKQWACHSGAEQAAGEWLCFMDADTYAEPELISRTLAFALAHDIDMLTLQPWYELRGLWERVVLPTGLAQLLIVFPPDRVNDPNRKLSMANGQFILIRRDVYDAIGGHASVKDCMMDDFPLAERVKGAGYRLYIADGSSVMRVRLYTNLQEIWAGSIKAAVEITGGWLISTLTFLALFLFNVLPAFLLVWAILTGNPEATWVMSVAVSIQLMFHAFVRMAGFRVPPWSSVAYPFGSVIMTVILLDGMIRLASGGEIKWKGRDLLGRPELPVDRLQR
jgi:chlorobactene glucosyltransferase